MVASVIDSTLVSNAESLPRVYNSAQDLYGKTRTMKATVALTTEFDDGEVATLMKLPANASITSILFWSDDLGTAGALNLGLYTGPDTSNLTVAADACYAAAIDVNSAALSASDLTFSARDINLAANRIYDDAGDSQGDFSEYWLCLTGETADITAAGDVTVIVTIAVD